MGARPVTWDYTSALLGPKVYRNTVLSASRPDELPPAGSVFATHVAGALFISVKSEVNYELRPVDAHDAVGRYGSDAQ